jgi:hypothetical protein
MANNNLGSALLVLFGPVDGNGDRAQAWHRRPVGIKVPLKISSGAAARFAMRLLYPACRAAPGGSGRPDGMTLVAWRTY